MKAQSFTACSALLLFSVFGVSSLQAQTGGKPPSKATPDALADAAMSAQRDLTGSEESLSELRKVIEGEKVPLNDKLAALENTLLEKRRLYEETRKSADVRQLEINNMTLEGKARQEENLYLANLLDEYVRGFESRVHATEVAKYKVAIGDAKLAPENPNLSEAEKFQKRIVALDLTLARLEDVVGGTRFDAEVLDPNGVVAEGRVALIGPIAIFASPNSPLAGVVAASGSDTLPILRPLDEKTNMGISDLVLKGEGLLPFDPSRGGAFQEFLKKTSIVDTFLHGGPIMWPILLCSIVGLAVSIERVFFIFREKSRRQPRAVVELFEAVEQHHIKEAISIGEKSTDYVARMLSYALEHREKSFQVALMRSSQREVKRFSRSLWVLDTVITMAPLLGLLGTVTGMMGSFQMLGSNSSAGTGAIVAGIAEALIATAFGLVIAITALIPLNYLNEQIESVNHELDDAGRQLELVLHPEANIIIRDDSLPDSPTGGSHGASSSSNPEASPLFGRLPMPQQGKF